jgi:hypothetical protein
MDRSYVAASGCGEMRSMADIKYFVDSTLLKTRFWPFFFGAKEFVVCWEVASKVDLGVCRSQINTS